MIKLVMSNNIIIFLLIFLLFSCGTCKEYGSPLNNSIKVFEETFNQKVDIPIDIVDIPQKEEGYRTLGVCYFFKGPRFLRFILIDKTYWDNATPYQRESTIIHELGHCMFDLEHDDTMIGDFIFVRPKSIMHPYTFPQYEQHRDYYLKELFSRIPKSN
jgi:hypothetical protein